MKSNTTITEPANPHQGMVEVAVAGEYCANNPAPKYITKKVVAYRIQKTTRTVDAWMAAGILPYYKIGRSVLFDWEDVQRHLAEYFRVSRFSDNMKMKGVGHE